MECGHVLFFISPAAPCMMHVVLWITESPHVCTSAWLAEMWGGRGKFPLPTCNYLSASDGTLALVLHMLNTLGGLRRIDMKKASVMITSWEAWWDGEHNKVIGLQEEHLVFCLFAITVEIVRWEGNLEVDKQPALWIILLLNNLKLRGGRMGSLVCCTPRTVWDTATAQLADLSGGG